MTPGFVVPGVFVFRMSLNTIELNTVNDLYSFVEMAIQQTGLMLDLEALYRPGARHFSAECREVRWVYPSRPLPE
jgi:hypothetical protein